MAPFPTQGQVIAMDVLIRLLLAEDIKRAPDPQVRIDGLRRAAVTLGQKFLMKSLSPEAADKLAIEIEYNLNHHIDFAVQIANEGGLVPKTPPPGQ